MKGTTVQNLSTSLHFTRVKACYALAMPIPGPPWPPTLSPLRLSDAPSSLPQTLYSVPSAGFASPSFSFLRAHFFAQLYFAFPLKVTMTLPTYVLYSCLFWLLILCLLLLQQGSPVGSSLPLFSFMYFIYLAEPFSPESAASKSWINVLWNVPHSSLVLVTRSGSKSSSLPVRTQLLMLKNPTKCTRTWGHKF